MLESHTLFIQNEKMKTCTSKLSPQKFTWLFTDQQNRKYLL